MTNRIRVGLIESRTCSTKGTPSASPTAASALVLCERSLLNTNTLSFGSDEKRNTVRPRESVALVTCPPK
jgi:hypothetical protein